MFTVLNGSGTELKKDFDSTIKGNAFFLEGHKIIMPPSASSEKGSGQQSTGKLDIVHRYLVMQIFLQSGDPFSCELQVRDKNNV
jgi:hypothetical protein